MVNAIYGRIIHVETVVLLINQNHRQKHTVSIGIDADEYRKIKTGKNN